jgi:hypothetical protein
MWVCLLCLLVVYTNGMVFSKGVLFIFVLPSALDAMGAAFFHWNPFHILCMPASQTAHSGVWLAFYCII